MTIHSWSRRSVVALATVALLSLVSGCGGSSSSGLDRTPVATKLSLKDNSFAFANFSAKNTTEEFGAEDLVAMFGSSADVCKGGRTPCVPTPEAAAFARMVNQARSSGHCEGLVALTASRFVDKLTPATGELEKEPDVVHAILRAFASQFLPESKAETDGWAQKSINEILTAISANLGKDIPEYTLNVYSPNGGHALLPLAIDFPDNDTALLHVYDSNWPDQDRYVKFDLKKKEWSFSFSGKDQTNDPKMWKGKAGDLDIASLGTRKASSCPFCGSDSSVQGTMLVIRSVDKKIEIETTEGTVTPDAPKAGGVTLRPLAGPGASPESGQPRDYIVTIPAKSNVSKIKAGSESRIVAVTPKAIAEVTTPSSGTSSTIEFSPEGVSVNDPSVFLTLASGDNVVTSTGSNNSIQVGENGVTVTVDGADGKPVTVETTTEEPAVQVSGGGSAGLPEGANYVVESQVEEDIIKKTVVNEDGSSTDTTVEGSLNNTSTSANLPDPLAATDEVPGLPPESERSAAVEETPESTTTTVEATGDDGDPASGDAGSTTKTTVKPKTTTTVAQKVVQRTTVTIGMNLDEWSFGPSDAASSGFNATLTATNADFQVCSTASCLEGVLIEAVATGTDATTGRTVTTTASFSMKNAAVPFAVRCGTKGSWIDASPSGGLYSASCTISSVTSDDLVYLRA